MTSQSTIVQLSKQELSALCSQVPETVATDIPAENRHNRQFGSADLWQIRNRGRGRTTRRDLNLYK